MQTTRHITLSEACDILEDATITQTMDHGFAIAHAGTTGTGSKFIMVNDMNGDTVFIEG